MSGGTNRKEGDALGREEEEKVLGKDMRGQSKVCDCMCLREMWCVCVCGGGGRKKCL